MGSGKRRRTQADRIASQQKLRARHAEKVAQAKAPTRERLAKALQDADAPLEMVERALSGYYDEYNSDSVLPLMELVDDANRAGLDGIVKRVVAGEFDATREEADAYWNSAEGKATMAELGRTLAASDEQLAAVADANREPTGPDGKPRAGALWNPPAGRDYDALNADEVHAAANLGARSGASNFQIGPQFVGERYATTNSWTAAFHFKRLGTKIQVWSRSSPAEAADALVRKMLRGARCTDCGGIIRVPGDRGVWFAGSANRPAEFHDGRTITLDEAMKLEQCRWRRVGRRWYSGCELTRAAATVAQSTQPDQEGAA